jgi:hypothetical protein
MKQKIPARAIQSRFKVARNDRGMIMATADLLITIPLVVMLSFFVVDSALGSYYKQRLGCLLDQAAEFGANYPVGKDPLQPTEEMVASLLRRSSMQALKLKVKAKEIEVEGNSAIEVSATGEFPLLQGSLLPVSIPLKETSVALVPVNKVCAFIALSPSSYASQYPGRGLSLYIPVVKPKQELPVWSFPYDTAIGSVSIAKGEQPTLPPVSEQSRRSILVGRESVY